MEIPLYIVDAFTDKPFSGNQAAVCWVGNRNLSEKRMQDIASEINLAETCFIWSMTNEYTEQNVFGLRWFTPTNEVALCGHATLASAATLFHISGNKNNKVTFSTLSGDLYAAKQNDLIALDFPANKPKACDSPQLKTLLESVIGADNLLKIQEILLSKTVKKLLVQMNDTFSLEDLHSIKPNFDQMLDKHDGSICKGIIITTKGEEGYDFFSRYFAPWNGIPEDHVTGSAHTVLAPYWRDVTGKEVMLGRQCSKRGGDVHVKVRSDGRVDISGKSTIVLKGQLCLPENI